MGGGDGTKVMGFGFADKTIIWDGTAIENTTRMLLEDQSDPLPLRTQDLPGVFDASLGASAVAEPAAAQDSDPDANGARPLVAPGPSGGV